MNNVCVCGKERERRETKRNRKEKGTKMQCKMQQLGAPRMHHRGATVIECVCVCVCVCVCMYVCMYVCMRASERERERGREREIETKTDRDGDREWE
jgi:hypothetical protein